MEISDLGIGSNSLCTACRDTIDLDAPKISLTKVLETAGLPRRILDLGQNIVDNPKNEIIELIGNQGQRIAKRKNDEIRYRFPDIRHLIELGMISPKLQVYATFGIRDVTPIHLDNRTKSLMIDAIFY